MDLPYLDIKNADVFEPVDYMCHRFLDPNLSIALTLIKIKLLLDFKSIQDTSSRNRTTLSSITANDKDTTTGRNIQKTIKMLEDHVGALYRQVNTEIKYFWPALVNPGNNLTVLPDLYSPGSKEHMQLLLRYNYSAWKQIPGAVDYIKHLATATN